MQAETDQAPERAARPPGPEAAPMGWRVLLSPPVAAVLVFCAALWLLDFPKPWNDDLFYTFPGLNLAQGGDFSNPTAARQQFPGHFFFAYPPLYPYTVAGWTKLFGISARSVTGLHCFLYFVTAAAAIAVLRRHSAPPWLQYLVPLAVTATFLPFGLRPEPVAAALAMAGFALVECAGRRVPVLFCAFVLMFLGGSTAPRLLVPTAALVLFAAWRVWGSGGSARVRLCLVATGALAAAVLCLLLMIGFRVRDFWTTFHFHLSARSGGIVETLAGFPRALLGVTHWPILALLPVSLILAWRRPKDDLARAGWVLAGSFPVVILMHSTGFGTLWYIALVVIFLAPSVVKSAAKTEAAVFRTALALALLLGNSKSLLLAAGMLSGQLKPDPGIQRDTALALRPTPGHAVLLDGWVARYLFDYRIPEGFLDFNVGAKFPKSAATTEITPGDIYLVGPQMFLESEMQSPAYGADALPMWSPLRVNRWAFPRYPKRVYVIRAEDCKEIHPGRLAP